jgi:hypothetical protein
LSTNSTNAITIDASQQVTLGTTAAGAGTNLALIKNMTGATGVSGVWLSSNVQSDATVNAFGFRTNIGTQATTFTLPSLLHVFVNQGTFGAGSTVTNQYGVFVNSTLTGATNNYGFYGDIASGANRWNFYAAGTAANYFGGQIQLNQDYVEKSTTANTSTAYTIDLTNGTLQILTLTGNCTYTFPTPVAGKSFILVQKQDATGGRTVTWPASVDWPSATAPTLTSTALKADKFVFTAIDGSNWLGSVAGQNYTV